VIVCTPNNPTGPAVTQTELDAFLADVPEHVVVVVDEAYLEFVRMADAVDGIATYARRPNVVLFRTFSKAYGLAGLRVGYAVAQPEVAAPLRAVSLPFGVSAVAQAAAIASLAAEDELLERVDALVAERDRVATGLRDAGWDVPEAQGNFFWFALGDRTTEFAAAADELGIVVRPFAGEGCRVSVGEVEANDRLLDLARSFSR
jgi:histidinol-phosphate aminotransferase